MPSSRAPDFRTRIAALTQRPEVRALARLARADANPVWIVGGAIRDAALGLPVPEVDAAVGRDAEGLALAMERAGHGTAVFLSRGRPGPRVYRVAGKRPLDLAEVEGPSIDVDLARRDFTVNAIAVSLETGAVLDPYGGLRDLNRGLLRCVRESNLQDDPLRALRAARLIATLGLRPDATASRAARHAAPGLRRVAPERRVAELTKLLAADSVRAAVDWAARTGVLAAALGLRLSLSTARSAARALAAFEGAASKNLDPDRRGRIRLAALAWNLSFSPNRTRRWLRGLRVSRRDADQIARLQTLAKAASSVRGRRDALLWRLEAGPLASDAAALMRWTDARKGALASRLQRLARAPLPRLNVNGADVLTWLSIPSGPRVGQLLSALTLEAALGTVRNRRQARNWLRGQVRERSNRL